MNKILLALAAAGLAASARAQTDALAVSARSFEAQAGAAIRPFVLEDSFAGVPECAVLDIKTIRAWTLDEARARAAPCLAAVGRRYSAPLTIEVGLLAQAQAGQPAKPGLLIKSDLVPGSKADRDLITSLTRREGRLLGQPARLLTRGEDAPAAISAVQQSLKRCLVIDVVRDIKCGGDFVKIYGQCLVSDPELEITEIRPGAGLTVTLQTEQTSLVSIQALNGFVTVNAGKGPVQVMVLAYGASTAAR